MTLLAVATTVTSPAAPVLDEFALNLIRSTARRLSRQAAFSRDERDDLEQDLTLAVLTRIPDYEPSRGHFYAYLTAIVDRHAKSLGRHRRAECRTFLRGGTSLNVKVSDEDGEVEFAATVTSDAHGKRTGQVTRTPCELVDLKHDLELFLETLPPDLKKLAHRLRTENVASIASATGKSRPGVHRQLQRLRNRMLKAGLNNFF